MLTSVVRVILVALIVSVVTAVGWWFAASGVPLVACIGGAIGALAFGLLLIRLWNVYQAIAWLTAVVFCATMLIPVIALGQDSVLATRGQQIQGTITGYRHASGPHNSSDYTEVRTKTGQYLEVSGSIGSPGDSVTLLVDPTGRVVPKLVSDVTVESDIGWSAAGLTVVLAVIVISGITGERERRTKTMR